jgi:hypothetical protein
MVTQWTLDPEFDGQSPSQDEDVLKDVPVPSMSVQTIETVTCELCILKKIPTLPPQDFLKIP